MHTRQRETWRSALRPVSYVIAGLSLAMVLCAAVGGLAPFWGLQQRPIDEGKSLVMAATALVTGLGAALMYTSSEPSAALGRRQATLAVALIWLTTGFFGSLPFIFDAGLSPVDAFFETVSGFTTTGATIVPNIESTLSHPLLLWRSITQWLGGMGIVVLFVAVFPGVGVGGKHLFRGEVPGPVSEGLVPRIRETSVVLWQLYTLFTLVLIAALWAVGVSLWDSVNHALTTLSTGGFSTYDSSVAGLGNPWAELVITAAMLVAGVNFGLYFGAARHGSLAVFGRSTEFRVYLGLVGVATVGLTYAVWPMHGDVFTALRKSLFMVATTITSTGFGNGDDTMAYPGSGLSILLLLMFVGGMAGSTAGGIKIARVTVLSKGAWAHIRTSFRPSVVQVMRIDGKPVPATVIVEVGALLTIYLACLGLGTLLITLLEGHHGVGADTAFGAMLSCLSNMGPAPFHINADNFAGYGWGAKLVFCGAMILGRLEFFTLLSLLLPDFWDGFSVSADEPTA